MVSVDNVWLPSCPSQTTTSSTPPAMKPSTAALISPVSSWRISWSLGSVWSCRQTPPTPSASVISKTVLFCAQPWELVNIRRHRRKRIWLPFRILEGLAIHFFDAHHKPFARLQFRYWGLKPSRHHTVLRIVRRNPFPRHQRLEKLLAQRRNCFEQANGV